MNIIMNLKLFTILHLILYLGVILGIIGTVSVSPGFISPIVVGYFTRNQVVIFNDTMQVKMFPLLQFNITNDFFNNHYKKNFVLYLSLRSKL